VKSIPPETRNAPLRDDFEKRLFVGGESCGRTVVEEIFPRRRVLEATGRRDRMTKEK